MHEFMLLNGSPGQDPDRQTKLMTVNLLYAVPDGESTKIMTTNLLYASLDLEPTKVMTVNLLYAIPEV